MIETPSDIGAVQYQPLEYLDDETDAPAERRNNAEGDLRVGKDKPITSSIRQTLRHLRHVGGNLSYWRGLNISVCYNVLHTSAIMILSGIFSILPLVGTKFAAFLGSLVAGVALCTVHMTWTHIVISEPSPLRWYRRIPKGPTYFRALVVPTVVLAVAQSLTFALPMMVHSSFGPIPDFNEQPATPAQARHELWRLFTSILVLIFVALALLLPASVTLTRVEASLLPDDTEAIVTFDRTLGGAAINLVGFGKANFRVLYDAAWRSFDRSSRMRLVKFYLKYIAILVVIDLLFFGVIAGEVIALLGADTLAAWVRAINSGVQGGQEGGK